MRSFVSDAPTAFLVFSAHTEYSCARTAHTSRGSPALGYPTSSAALTPRLVAALCRPVACASSLLPVSLLGPFPVVQTSQPAPFSGLWGCPRIRLNEREHCHGGEGVVVGRGVQDGWRGRPVQGKCGGCSAVRGPGRHPCRGSPGSSYSLLHRQHRSAPLLEHQQTALSPAAPSDGATPSTGGGSPAPSAQTRAPMCGCCPRCGDRVATWLPVKI